jgi:hypothetical protein
VGLFALWVLLERQMHEAPKGSSASHTDAGGVQAPADGVDATVRTIPPGRGRHRSFQTSPYVVAGSGRLRPVAGLRQCPQAKGAEVCKLRKVGFRPRKTGPCHPIAVIVCRIHGGHFTVYPPGFAPYARERHAPLDTAGQAVKEVEVTPAREAWRETMFPRSHRSQRRNAVAR